VSKLLEKLRSGARGAFLSRSRGENESAALAKYLCQQGSAAALRCASLDYRKMHLRHDRAFPFIFTKACAKGKPVIDAIDDAARVSSKRLAESEADIENDKVKSVWISY